jgi:hypothetical protein
MIHDTTTRKQNDTVPDTRYKIQDTQNASEQCRNTGVACIEVYKNNTLLTVLQIPR